MRLILAALCVAACTSMASAQTQSEVKQPGDSQHSTGRTVLPDENKGQLQPQGWTGPITTGSGGPAPAGKPSRAVAARHAGCARVVIKEHRWSEGKQRKSLTRRLETRVGSPRAQFKFSVGEPVG